MNPNRKINPEKINIINIKTKKGNIDAGDDNQLQNIRGYTFNFNVGSGFNQDKNIFGIELSVEIIAMDNSDVPLGPKGAYTIEVLFNVENLQDFIEIKDDANPPLIDGLLVSTLGGIAFSTIRGIIYTRTQGTSLGAVILPVLDPKRLMEANR